MFYENWNCYIMIIGVFVLYFKFFVFFFWNIGLDWILWWEYFFFFNWCLEIKFFMWKYGYWEFKFEFLFGLKKNFNGCSMVVWWFDNGDRFVEKLSLFFLVFFFIIIGIYIFLIYIIIIYNIFVIDFINIIYDIIVILFI